MNRGWQVNYNYEKVKKQITDGQVISIKASITLSHTEKNNGYHYRKLSPNTIRSIPSRF